MVFQLERDKFGGLLQLKLNSRSWFTTRLGTFQHFRMGYRSKDKLHETTVITLEAGNHEQIMKMLPEG